MAKVGAAPVFKVQFVLPLPLDPLERHPDPTSLAPWALEPLLPKAGLLRLSMV